MPQVLTPARLFGLSLAATVCAFAVPLWLTLARHPAQNPEAATPAPTLLHDITYVPLPQPLLTSIEGGQRTLELGLTFALITSEVDLRALGGMLLTDLPLLVTELSEAVRLTDEAAASPEALRAALPEALRKAVNRRYGTEELPEPVQEVLISEYTLN